MTVRASLDQVLVEEPAHCGNRKKKNPNTKNQKTKTKNKTPAECKNQFTILCLLLVHRIRSAALTPVVLG